MSAIDICNAALAMNHHMEAIPADADLDNPDGKAEILCSRFYDQARREALRMAPWTCIVVRRQLAGASWESGWPYAEGDLLIGSGRVYKCTTAGTSGTTEPTWPTTGTVDDGTATWTFQYSVLGTIPDDNYTGLANASAIPVDYIIQVEVTNSIGELVHFQIERGVLYSDHANPVLVYVPDEEDDTKWDPLLREVVITQLASKLAYPLAGSHENEVALAQAAMGLAQAALKKTRAERRQGVPPSDQWMDDLYNTRYNP